jgi:hypothetical protein
VSHASSVCTHDHIGRACECVDVPDLCVYLSTCACARVLRGYALVCCECMDAYVLDVCVLDICMDVCMCMCVCAYFYVRVYIRVGDCMCAWDEYNYVYIYVCVHMCTYVCTYVRPST